MARSRRKASPAAPVAALPAAPALALPGRLDAGRMLAWVAGALLLMSLAASVPGLWRLLGYPLEANFGEGVVQAEARRLARGGWGAVYRSPDGPPWWAATYGPVGLWLGSWGGAEASLGWVRSVALLGGLAAAGGLAAVVLLGGRSWRGAVGWAGLAAGLWLTSPFLGEWLVVGRVDLVGRAFQAGAVLSAVVAVVRPGWGLRAAAAGGVAAALAILTKQSHGAGFLTAVGVLLWERRFRDAATLAGVAAGVITMVLLYVHIRTGGWSTQNLFAGTARGLDFNAFIAWWGGFLSTHFLLLLSAAAAVSAAWRTGVAGRALVMACAAGLPHALLAGNDGADRNYFFDLAWALSGVVALGAMTEQRRLRRWQILGLAALHAALVCLVLGPRTPTAGQVARAQGVAEDLRRFGQQGALLCEYPGWTITAGQDPDVLPYMMKLWEGTAQEKSFLNELERKRYRYVFLSKLAAARFSPSVRRAISETYLPTAMMKDLYFTDGELEVTLWEAKR